MILHRAAETEQNLNLETYDIRNPLQRLLALIFPITSIRSACTKRYSRSRNFVSFHVGILHVLTLIPATARNNKPFQRLVKYFLHTTPSKITWTTFCHQDLGKVCTNRTKEMPPAFVDFRVPIQSETQPSLFSASLETAYCP